MVPRNAIVEWATKYPWQRNEQVEQDLIICRALVAIFSDPLLSDLLAFKGGTAIHKLYFENQPRYSEDIDLVQVSPGPIKPILERHEVLPLLRKGIAYDPVAAWRRIRQCFIDRLQTERDREWLAKTKKNSSIASEAS